MAEHCDALPLPVNGQPASRRFPDFQTNTEPYRVIPVRLFLFPVPFPAGIHGAAPFSNRFPARSDALSRFSRIPGRLPTVFYRRTPTVIAGPPWYTFGTPRIHMVDAIRTNQRKGTQRTACPNRKSPHASRPGRNKGSKTDPKKKRYRISEKEERAKANPKKNRQGFLPSATAPSQRAKACKRSRSNTNQCIWSRVSRTYKKRQKAATGRLQPNKAIPFL